MKALALAFMFGVFAQAPQAQEQTAQGGSAVLRGLDKISGAVSDIEIRAGSDGRVGRLSLEVKECRYPIDNPAGDAFAWVTIRDDLQGAQPVFQGWMIASSPALSAMDHHRYDVWLIRCSNS
ncbi:MAG: DUF2155 domain-containing protein [Pseudomonadota bacterium]